MNYLIIKELIFKKKFKKVKIISDNKVTLKIFDNLNVEIEKIIKFDLKFRLPHLKIIKFLIKAMILVFYCKLSKFKKKEKVKKILFIYHSIQINIFIKKIFEKKTIFVIF